MHFCTQCGAELGHGHFCGRCGAPVEPDLPKRWAGPMSAGERKSEPAGRAEFGAITESHMGALAYLTPLVALFFLLCPPMSNSRFVRFHSYQCLFVTLAAVAAAIAFVGTLSYSLVGVESPSAVLWFVLPVALAIAFLAALILAAYRAWHGKEIKLPLLGSLAARCAPTRLQRHGQESRHHARVAQRPQGLK